MASKDYIEICFSGPLKGDARPALTPLFEYFHHRGVSKFVGTLLVDAEENVLNLWDGEVGQNTLLEALEEWGKRLVDKKLRFRCLHGASKTLYTPTISQEGEPDFPMPLSHIDVDLSASGKKNFQLHGRSVGYGILPQTAPQNGLFWLVLLGGLMSMGLYVTFR